MLKSKGYTTIKDYEASLDKGTAKKFNQSLKNTIYILILKTLRDSGNAEENITISVMIIHPCSAMILMKMLTMKQVLLKMKMKKLIISMKYAHQTDLYICLAMKAEK